LPIRNVLLFTLLLHGTAFTQANITGVINQYYEITAVDIVSSNALTLASVAGLSVGDEVLIIQMQGATISETDDANFGTISNYNDAGNYEIGTICDITGNVVLFDDVLVNSYTANGNAQVVSIPHYTDALISGGALTCDPWDGTTGGVLILKVDGTLDFGNENIITRGLGFRGFAALTSNGNCSGFSPDNTYFKPFTDPSVRSRKGEGIAEIITGKECGRGPQANGGGGGNNHNGGGGGGGNFGDGGAGGRRISSNVLTCGSLVGLNSISLAPGYGSNKIFMGGAGGTGNGNNSPETNEHGLDGAGVVIIIAETVAGSNQTIFAEGIDAGTASYDGAGGGSGGGAVLLDVTTFSSALTVDVSGGDGGDIFDTGSSNCNGPGGGGGGGVVWFSAESTPANVTTVLSGGAAGQILNTEQGNCTVGSLNGAVNGTAGSELHSLVIPESTIDYIDCAIILPVTTVSFSGDLLDREAHLRWVTVSEFDNDYFVLEQAVNDDNFVQIATIDGVGTTTETTEYSYIDLQVAEGDNYYQLTQVDNDGTKHSIGIIALNYTSVISDLRIVPNPASESIGVMFTASSHEDCMVTLADQTGRVVYSEVRALSKGTNTLPFTIADLANGLYFVQINVSNRRHVKRFIKE